MMEVGLIGNVIEKKIEEKTTIFFLEWPIPCPFLAYSIMFAA